MSLCAHHHKAINKKLLTDISWLEGLTEVMRQLSLSSAASSCKSSITETQKFHQKLTFLKLDTRIEARAIAAAAAEETLDLLLTLMYGSLNFKSISTARLRQPASICMMTVSPCGWTGTTALLTSAETQFKFSFQLPCACLAGQVQAAAGTLIDWSGQKVVKPTVMNCLLKWGWTKLNRSSCGCLGLPDVVEQSDFNGFCQRAVDLRLFNYL